MRRPWALLPGDYVDGVRVVETTLRPARPGCLIPDDDPGIAAGFVRSRCLAWGGHASYAIPYSRSRGLTERWEALLDLLDPDEVFALGSLQEAEKKRLRDAGWFVYPIEDPMSLFTFTGALLYSALAAVGQGLRPPESEHFLVVPEMGQGTRAHLPLLARFGSLEEAELKRYLEHRHSHYAVRGDLSQLVRVEEVDSSRAPSDTFAGDLRGLIAEEEVEYALTFPDLTRIGLGVTGSPRWTKGLGRSEVENDYRAPLVVTGTQDSVEDFALYWNLRAEHPFADPFPLWLPLDLLEDGKGADVLERALGRANEGLVTPRVRRGSVRIVSASTGAEELEERLREGYPEVQIGVDSFVELFRTRCDYHHTTEHDTAHFERGRASIRPPRSEDLKHFIPYIDHVAYDVGVEGVWLPQSGSLVRKLNWMPEDSRKLVSKRGTLRFVKSYNKEVVFQPDLLELRTPDGWSLLSSIFEESGYSIEPTTKSRAALGQLELLGGTENIDVVASSKVRKLLRELSLRRGGERLFVAERKTLSFARFEEELGTNAAREILRWLVERRVVFRGTILECPRCTTSAWYPVDRVGEVWRCDGCQEESPVPLDMDETDWHYRINELYARGHDQGTLTPLLTLRSILEAWGNRPRGGGMGFYPGVELQAQQGTSVPFPHKEIDLVVLNGSNLIFAECKESTEHLNKPEKTSKFARQLADSVVLADHLGASRLIIASSTMFPIDKETLLSEAPTGHSVEVHWMDGRHLLDPDYFTNPLSFPRPDGGVSKPEGWEAGYLKILQDRFANPVT
jgi:hypothetical protein